MILYTSQLFAQYGLIAGSTDKSLDFKKGNPNLENSFQHLLQHYGFEKKDYLGLNQIHSTIILEDPYINQNTEGDGIITKSKTKFLGIKTGDCIPLILHDLNKGVTIAVHAGRKGVRNGIVDKALNIFKNCYNTDPKDLIVYIGPNIGYKNHLVFEEELQGFDEKYYQKLPKGQHVVNNSALYQDFKNKNNLTDKDLNNYTSAFLDLKQIVLDKLQIFGMVKDNLDDCGIDSFFQTNTHSYRRDYPNSGLTLTFFGYNQNPNPSKN
jgi:YfiH family protein